MTKQVFYKIKSNKAVRFKEQGNTENIDLENIESGFFKTIAKNLEFSVGYYKGKKVVNIWAGSYAVEVPIEHLKLILETSQSEECENIILAREI